jgi:Pyruvate/2-oxoacid:ferredoxin oxidoreductase delta subunit
MEAMMEETKIFCFSGTGNSYAVAKEIGGHFSVEPELMTHYKDINTIAVTASRVGIVAPVYLNDIPKPVKEFLLKLSFADAAPYVFAVLTSGSGENKSGFKNIDIALAQHGARLSLAYDVKMPSAFQARADMESVLSAVPDTVAEIAGAVENRRENYTPQGAAALPKDFTKLSFMYKPLTRLNVTAQCTGCGLCCKLCPISNIELRDNKAVRGKNCVACTACASWCPQHAIKNRMSRMLKGQYHHPAVSANDLL